MRDAFADALWITETITDQGGDDYEVVSPVSNVEVSVYAAGTTTLATIYTSRAASTPKGNPHVVTGGNVSFWAEVGDYDIKVHDLNSPTRFSDVTIGWNAISGAPRGIPSNRLAGDAGVQHTAFDASATRQLVPIGTVIDWWRPTSAIPIPTGYEVADGRSISAANHDFGTGGSITLPDMRNTFALGAHPDIPDGTAATSGDHNLNSPGIGGLGGGNVKNFQHSHTVTAHAHAISSDGAHTHTVPNHAHTGLASGNTGPDLVSGGSAGQATDAIGNVTHHHAVTLSVTVPATSGATTTGSSGAHSHGGATASATSTTDNGLSATFEIRPKYVGLLKLMKVKRS